MICGVDEDGARLEGWGWGTYIRCFFSEFEREKRWGDVDMLLAMRVCITEVPRPFSLSSERRRRVGGGGRDFLCSPLLLLDLLCM